MCMGVWMAHVCALRAVCAEARKEHWIMGNQSYTQALTTTGVLRFEPGSSGRTARALNRGSISSALRQCYL